MTKTQPSVVNIDSETGAATVAAVHSGSLDRIGVIATLNAVLGIWTLTDAANAVGLTPQHLIDEAQGWAAAGEVDV